MSNYDIVKRLDNGTGSQTITVVPRATYTLPSHQYGHGQRKSVVLIMGATGVGKSSLVATLSGQPVAVGHSLSSCTSECQAWEYSVDGDHVVQLVDTPGFNDTKRSDIDILSSISNWTSLNKVTISGVVYMHRITDKRFTGASRMNLNILVGMCGEHFLPHVVLCSTMWNSLPNQQVMNEAAAREHELVSSPDFWSPIIGKGANYMRYMGDQVSGQAIIGSILEHPATHAMSLQLELRNPDCPIEDTVAGRLITAEIRRKEEKLRQERLEEEEEEREMREELALEQEATRREEQRQRVREAAITRRVDSRNTRDTRDVRLGGPDDMAVIAAEVSWRFGPITGRMNMPAFKRQR
ncbi:Nn.00g062320.m01.CDS01 [Neocucurbitaria sp. VM-36]